MGGTEDTMAMERDLLMLNLLLMLKLMLGTDHTMAMALDTTVDTGDTMAMVLVTMVGTEDTMAMERDLLMPSLQPMLMPQPTLGMDIMDMDTVHTMGTDTGDTDMEATGDTTGDKNS